MECLRQPDDREVFVGFRYVAALSVSMVRVNCLDSLMFILHDEIQRLDIPATRVKRLFRSLGGAQVALPGRPAQRATAYLCAYSDSAGARVAAVFHLLEAQRLAFYLNDQGEVSLKKLQSVLDEGERFAESMGFILDEIELQHLEPEEKDSKWQACPVSHGVETAVPSVLPLSRPGQVLLPGPPGSVKALAESTAASAGADAADIRRKLFLEKLGRFLSTL